MGEEIQAFDLLIGKVALIQLGLVALLVLGAVLVGVVLGLAEEALREGE